MPAIKPKRKVPSIDMTAMVDVAFLLLTFFILTTQFRPEEEILVDTPSSAVNDVVDDAEFLVVTVNENGKVFLSWKNQVMGRAMIDKISNDYNLDISETGKSYFAARSGFGAPFSQLPAWLNTNKIEDIREFPQTGILVSNERGRTNELKEWLKAAKMSTGGKIRFAIKGDRETEYPAIDNVISTIQETGENKFHLITSLESDPLADRSRPH